MTPLPPLPLHGPQPADLSTQPSSRLTQFFSSRSRPTKRTQFSASFGEFYSGIQSRRYAAETHAKKRDGFFFASVNRCRSVETFTIYFVIFIFGSASGVTRTFFYCFFFITFSRRACTVSRGLYTGASAAARRDPLLGREGRRGARERKKKYRGITYGPRGPGLESGLSREPRSTLSIKFATSL